MITIKRVFEKKKNFCILLKSVNGGVAVPKKGKSLTFLGTVEDNSQVVPVVEPNG